MSITRINNHIAAINANRNLDTTGTRLQKSMERLSSGLRINRAGDDAAGMTVVTRIRSQVRGLQRAILNAQDGMSVINVAEGAMEETTVRLNRMRVLAIQAANTGVNDAQARQALQDEVFQSIDEITRIATTTTFNTNYLLNGDFEVKSAIKPGQDGAQNFGIHIDPGTSSTTLQDGTAFLHILNTIEGKAQFIGGEGKGEQQVFATGVRDASDIAISLGFFGTDASLGSAGLAAGAAMTNETFNNVSLAANDILAFEGVLADGVTRYNGIYTIAGTTTNFASAVNAAISSAEIALFGATVDTGYDVSAYFSAGRIHLGITSGLAAANLSTINIRAIDAATGAVNTERLGVTRTAVDIGGVIGFGTGYNNTGQVGNNVQAITGSTFDSGQFEIYVDDVQGEVQRTLESTVAFTGTNGQLLAVGASLATFGAINGRFENGIYTGYATIAAGDTITLDGTNHDGTTFTRTFTIDTAAGTDANVNDGGKITSVSGLIRELNSRVFSGGEQVTFNDAVATFSTGYIRVVEEIGRDDSQLSFTLRFNTADGPTTINDDALLLQEGFTQAATFHLSGGERVRATSGDVITLSGEESTIEGIPTPKITFRVGDNLTTGTDHFETTAPEYVGSLNGGPEVTFRNGDQDIVFIDDSSFERGVARYLTIDFDSILDITKSDSSPDPGTTILISTVNHSMNFQIGAYANQNFRVSVGDLTAENLGFGKGSGRAIRDIDVSSVTGANEALAIIDEALDQVNRTRSLLGAATNRMESTVTNLSVSVENLTASESRLRDVDIAAESSIFAAQQVKLQAGVSVLAQANFTPQTFLSLLG